MVYFKRDSYPVLVSYPCHDGLQRMVVSLSRAPSFRTNHVSPKPGQDAPVFLSRGYLTKTHVASVPTISKRQRVRKTHVASVPTISKRQRMRKTHVASVPTILNRQRVRKDQCRKCPNVGFLHRVF